MKPNMEHGRLLWRMSNSRKECELLEWDAHARRWAIIGSVTLSSEGERYMLYSLHWPGGSFDQRFPEGIKDLDKAKTYVEALCRMTR